MDERQQARIVGLAMSRGLIGIEAVQRAVCSSECDLLKALLAAGALDEIDVEVLDRIPDPPFTAGLRYSPSCPGAEPALSAEGGRKVTGDGPEDGKVVRECFALPSWKDYRDLRFVAEGGLGRIFAAFDPSLKRHVALKFLRRDDPSLARRFVLEAQHQARVEHPNICKVFEVGEWKGQAYIAMQFIQGETLETAAVRMSLDEKIETLEIVAEAVNAAHRQGLIHRDIKPANIMIEWNQGEKAKPFVLDFGLAKGLGASELTLQGMVLGTMHYMAPEQAMGQVDRIGRRTDVYGLGATLFRILTGRLMFQGTDSLDGVRRTAEEEPPRLRQWVPDAPKDLETIVMKCLAKDPERRYESALALAEDLRRCREGEPVLARPASPFWRGWSYLRRHRTAVAMSLAAVLSVAALGTWALALNLRARRVSAFATSFGVEAEGLSASLRMAYLLPRHDIRVHKEQVRHRMASIRQMVEAEGSLAEGPGAYALGQGHLALHEYSEARRELEKAWAAGFRTPRVALALGQALGGLYREGWEDARHSGDLKFRESRKRFLACEFRDPALGYLRLASEIPDRKAYLEALLAYFEERYPTAVAKAQEAFRQEPALYEAKVLEGDARMAMGMACLELDAPGFARRLLEAGEAYAMAMDMARSDPALIYAEGIRRCELAEQAFLASRTPQEDYEQLQALLDQVLAVDPEACHVFVAKARLATAFATCLGDHGRDPFPVLGQAISWCGKAVRCSQGLGCVSALLGDVYTRKAAYQMDRGQDPARSLEEAFARLQEANGLQPGDAWIHQRLAEVCTMRGALVDSRGEDPQALLMRGLFHAGEAGRLAGSGRNAVSAAVLHGALGDWKRENGEDPQPDYRQGLACCREAIHLSPRDGAGYAHMADCVVRYAAHLQDVGASPDAVLQEGLDAGERGVVLDPSFFNLLSHGDCLLLKAQVLAERGQAALEALQKADACLRRAGSFNPRRNWTLSWREGLLAMMVGLVEAQHGRRPSLAWSQADQFLARACRMNPRAPQPLLARVRLVRLREEWLGAHVGAASSGLMEGFALAAKGFSLKPRQPELRALRGCLYRLEARGAKGPLARLILLESARCDLEAALAQNPYLAREFGPELEAVKELLPGESRRGDGGSGALRKRSRPES